jgi:hypothetical protein
MNKNNNVVFLIPSSSKNCDYKNVNDCLLINTFFESIKQFDITPYKFIVGIDDDDEFYLKEIENIKAILPNNFYYHFLNNYDKSYCCIVNQIANIAINNYDAEFLYLVADDLIIYTLEYIDVFVDYIKNNNNLGLGQPVDKSNIQFKHMDPSLKDVGICTHPFVHVNHVKYLGYFIPPQIKNWFCDNWITYIYRTLGKIIITNKFVIENKIFNKRYEPVCVDHNNLNMYITQAINTLITCSSQKNN